MQAGGRGCLSTTEGPALMRLLDNKAHGRVVDALSAALQSASELAILSSEFSVFAFDALRQGLEGVERT